ncbi:hypothetical protein [Herbaspirillum sp. SJZ107]|uniref:hypothetical protein n=1 Tax=Herbaspirillum sp. SJZ107 TaxID=2572881 RepID=UPI00116D897C|nr:hypothetical protein [Herbaspirillum sp. SJZ107]TQK06720.1 hypothetical protein FBX97_1983 [Herbaspirillum sp. SJZ107]
MDNDIARRDLAEQRRNPQHHGHVDYERQLDHDLNRHSPPREQLQSIPGWGSDLDHKNRPAIPMERMPPRFIHVPQGQPVQQAQTVEVFCSPERPGITPIFGTAEPPKWVSGAIRRLAYKLPENDLRHWLMLIAADRVNMVEGIVDDLRHGHLPNVLGEMGIRSELRHNPAGLVRKALITAAVVGGVMALMKRRDRY